MNCDQVKEMLGLYLDSELDGRSAQEVRTHLEQCQACAELCRTEQRFNEALQARLRPAAPTAALWEAEEAFVTEAFKHQGSDQATLGKSSLPRRPRSSFWREFLWPAPGYYAGLAAVWLLLLVLRPGAPVSGGQPTMARSRTASPSPSALFEQRREQLQALLRAEAAAEKPLKKTTSPRSEREETTREG
jgi:anti-sigma factor RsiW